jgi:O-antigen ligase
MSSKELNKDAEGIYALTDRDVQLIEEGITNHLYTNKSGIENRIHELIYEYESYKRGKNPTGHSFLMRLEFWRIGWEIIKRKPIYGVGTGDGQRAYYYQYSISGTKLSKDWQKRSHNQFMAITIGFGIIGLIVFLFYLFYPVISIKNKHYLFSTFLIISLVSMLNEDTLETQAGVTFFGFFYSLLLFSSNYNKSSKNKEEISA